MHTKQLSYNSYLKPCPQLTDQELFSLYKSEKLSEIINPHNYIDKNWPIRKRRRITKSAIYMLTAVSILGHLANIGIGAYMPPDRYQNLFQRLYYLILSDNELICCQRMMSDSYNVNTGITTHTKFNRHNQEITLYRTDKEQAYNKEVIDSIQKENISILSLGIGRSLRINHLKQRLLKLGIKQVSTYGINLTTAATPPKLSSPCFIGHFEDHDFIDHKFDLLFSNVGASFYTPSPDIFLHNLLSIMNHGAMAWLDIYDEDHLLWQKALDYYQNISYEYLYDTDPILYEEFNGTKLLPSGLIINKE